MKAHDDITAELRLCRTLNTESRFLMMSFRQPVCTYIYRCSRRYKYRSEIRVPGAKCEGSRGTAVNVIVLLMQLLL